MDNPAPFVLRARERSEQSVVLTIDSDTTPATVTTSAQPSITVALSTQVGLCHYDPRDGRFAKEPRQYGEFARSIGAKPALEAIVPCAADYRAEVASMATALAESGTRFER